MNRKTMLRIAVACFVIVGCFVIGWYSNEWLGKDTSTQTGAESSKRSANSDQKLIDSTIAQIKANQLNAFGDPDRSSLDLDVWNLSPTVKLEIEYEGNYVELGPRNANMEDFPNYGGAASTRDEYLRSGIREIRVSRLEKIDPPKKQWSLFSKPKKKADGKWEWVEKFKKRMNTARELEKLNKRDPTLS